LNDLDPYINWEGNAPSDEWNAPPHPAQPIQQTPAPPVIPEKRKRTTSPLSWHERWRRAMVQLSRYPDIWERITPGVEPYNPEHKNHKKHGERAEKALSLIKEALPVDERTRRWEGVYHEWVLWNRRCYWGYAHYASETYCGQCDVRMLELDQEYEEERKKPWQ